MTAKMKTISQIREKTESLKKRLMSRAVTENFGENERHELEDFIGATYAYDYTERLTINSITASFFDWCVNYTGRRT